MISKSILLTLQCLSCVLILSGIVLIFSGMFSSGWLVADFDLDRSQHHGLWKDCQRGHYGGHIRTFSEWLCFLKIDHQNIDPQRQFKTWQIQTLCLLGSANGLAFFALILLAVSCCYGRLCSIPWAVMSFIATVVSTSGIILFCRWATETDNRFARYVTSVVEQQYGSAFWMTFSGCLMYLFATILAVACCVILCVNWRGLQPVRTSSRSSMNKPWQYTKANQSSNGTVV